MESRFRSSRIALHPTWISWIELLLLREVAMGCTMCRAVDVRDQRRIEPSYPQQENRVRAASTSDPYAQPRHYAPTPRSEGGDMLLVCADCLEEILSCGPQSRCTVSGKLHC